MNASTNYHEQPAQPSPDKGESVLCSPFSVLQRTSVRRDASELANCIDVAMRRRPADLDRADALARRAVPVNQHGRPADHDDRARVLGPAVRHRVLAVLDRLDLPGEHVAAGLRDIERVLERRADLRKVMLYFSDVDEIEPAEIRWDAIRFQRSNVSYRFLLSICQLVLEGMLITTDEGERKLARFVDDQLMSRLYEKFILEYYAAECDCASASSPQIKWALDDGLGTMLPVMQSDIVLSRRNRVLIIDAKYYTHAAQQSFDVATIHSANLYQIFTYVKNKEAELADLEHEVSGMLLYAKTDEEIQPDGVYQMSGNQISVKTLDLNMEFEEIRKQLDAIAVSHFVRSANG